MIPIIYIWKNLGNNISWTLQNALKITIAPKFASFSPKSSQKSFSSWDFLETQLKTFFYVIDILNYIYILSLN